ncbi:MAG: lysine--tRNA ligase, partial [Clostridia bacterium]|nr:lysine--tRNA ligase [Clostridia bacterium]
MQENNNQNVNEELELNELLQIRRDKLSALCEAGANPFEITKYDVTALSQDAIKEFEAREAELAEGEEIKVSVAGRMMSRRIMGKASFAHLMDEQGKVQLYVSRNDLGDDDYAAFKKWDIGDIIGVEGVLFRTRTGEVSIHAKKATLLAKSLIPLPEKFHGLKDL